MPAAKSARAATPKKSNKKPSTKLKYASRFNWKRALPVMIVVAAVGGYFLFRTFAYSYMVCKSSDPYPQYEKECIENSDEATVTRTYYAVLGRAPDSGGLTYWSKQLASKSVTLSGLVTRFMSMSEFKNKYGTLTNRQFVKALYPNVFGRPADTKGLDFWTNQLDTKRYTRATLMAYFIKSPEMKRLYATRVALILKVPLDSFTQKLATYTPSQITCHGTVSTDANGLKWCDVAVGDTDPDNYKRVAAVTLPLPNGQPLPKVGNYIVCSKQKTTNADMSKGYYFYGDLYGTVGAIDGGTAQLTTVLLSAGGLRSGFGGGQVTGTYYSLDTFSGARNCSPVYLIPSRTNAMTIVINTIDQPANATMNLDLSSFSIYQMVKGASVTPESFSKASDVNVLCPDCALPPQIVVNNRSVAVRDLSLEGKNFTATLAKPHWVHDAGYQSGKNTIYLNMWSDTYADSYVSMQIKTLDGTRGIPFKVYQHDDYGQKVLRYESGPMPFKLNAFTELLQGKDAQIEFELPRPETLRFEMSVDQGNLRIFSSQIVRDWQG